MTVAEPTTSTEENASKVIVAGSITDWVYK